MKKHRLSQCHKLLSRGIRCYEKKGHLLSISDRKHFEDLLESFENTLLKKDREKISLLAPELKSFLAEHFPKNFFTSFGEFCFGVCIALALAFIIRQTWFELYEVPTGSMRPTIEEKDRMIVSKTTFGIPIPFTNKLFFFNPDFISRHGIIVFTVRDLDIADPNMRYFYLFPGKKHFIKRCCAKGGDQIYFYGGRIYGIDEKGKPFDALWDEEILQKLNLANIEHIPFINFNGKIKSSDSSRPGIFQKSVMYQMNKKMVTLDIDSKGEADGHFFDGTQWKKEDLSAIRTHHTEPVAYSEMWGMGNYAFARILSREDITKIYHKAPQDYGMLYLELHHTPNLSFPHPKIGMDETGTITPVLSSFTTLVPLNKEHIDQIYNSLFTSRFRILDHRAYLYDGMNSKIMTQTSFEPLFPNIKNGTYEMQDGKVYRVGFGGTLLSQGKDHPLAKNTTDNVKKMFNLGVSFNLLFQPREEYQPFLPHRFAYFRNGDLYVLGKLLMKKNDPVLQNFVEKEITKEKLSTVFNPYIAFIDQGAPLTEDGLDIEKIRTYGLKIPPGHILALGDNYSMSADSRDFGFVPYNNLRGSPKFIFWPFGKQFGTLPQATTTWKTFPNVLIQTLAVVIIVACYTVVKIRRRKRRFKRIPFQ